MCVKGKQDKGIIRLLYLGKDKIEGYDNVALLEGMHRYVKASAIPNSCNNIYISIRDIAIKAGEAIGQHMQGYLMVQVLYPVFTDFQLMIISGADNTSSALSGKFSIADKVCTPYNTHTIKYTHHTHTIKYTPYTHHTIHIPYTHHTIHIPYTHHTIHIPYTHHTHTIPYTQILLTI